MEYSMNHRHELVTIDGAAGKLSGTLQIPSGEPRGAVLLAHCFTCSRSLKTTRQLSTGIEDGGFAVLRFDFTGLGESEGDFAETSVTSNIADLEAAAGYLSRRGFGPCVMVGHSLGGAATLLAAGNLPDVRAVVAVAAPFGPDHVRHLFSEQDVDRVFAHGRATLSIAGRPFDISRSFFEDLERHCTPERLAALGRPLLVVHGTSDVIVPISEGERIHAAAQQPKWFAGIPGADHMFVKPGAIEQAAAVIRTFLEVVVQ
jgi:pimeloyl-ACP methyl ester carboxylesterase